MYAYIFIFALYIERGFDNSIFRENISYMNCNDMNYRHIFSNKIKIEPILLFCYYMISLVSR